MFECFTIHGEAALTWNEWLVTLVEGNPHEEVVLATVGAHETFRKEM